MKKDDFGMVKIRPKLSCLNQVIAVMTAGPGGANRRITLPKQIFCFR